MNSPKPLNDLRNLFVQLPAGDEGVAQAIQYRSGFDQHDAVSNNLSGLLPWLAKWQGSAKPSLSETHICVLASAYENADNTQVALDFIANASKGSTPVNHLCKDRGVGLRVLEMAPSIPHKVGEEWREADCMAATAFGMEATASGGHLLGLTALAPGGDEVSKLLIEKVRGGSSNSSNKQEADALDLMRVHGGREIAGLVGALVAARSRRLPVLIEGWSAIAALFVVNDIDPKAIDHVQVAAVSDDMQLEYLRELGKAPIVGMQHDLGVGCGLVLAASCFNSLIYLIE